MKGQISGKAGAGADGKIGAGADGRPGGSANAGSSARIQFALTFAALFAVEAFIALRVHDRFVRPYLGDVMVVWLLYFLVRAFRPGGWRHLPLGLFVFAACVEGLQYFRIADLPIFAGNPAARIILGPVFDWKDIGCYGVGCLVLAAAEGWRRSGRRVRR